MKPVPKAPNHGADQFAIRSCGDPNCPATNILNQIVQSRAGIDPWRHELQAPDHAGAFGKTKKQAKKEASRKYQARFVSKEAQDQIRAERAAKKAEKAETEAEAKKEGVWSLDWAVLNSRDCLDVLRDMAFLPC